MKNPRTRNSKNGAITLILGALVAGTTPASAAIALSFEFNTPGTNQGWQHNGTVNGGTGATTGPTSISVPLTGEGVLTAQQLAGNGDLRVLYNPDISLDTVAFTGWTTIEIRFRQLDALNGNPQALTGTLSNLWLGTSGTGSSNITGTGFIEETPADSEFWYIASLDISGMGTNDITQIRIDPIASTTQNYQLDYVRINANPVPEPSIALLGLLSTGFLWRRQRA